MIQHTGMMLAMVVALTACDKMVDGSNFTPREKEAQVDPKTGTLTMPHPCPDWSQSQTQNYKNDLHSNFGCAVNSNLAAQIENPRDLVHGHGKRTPDTETTTSVIEQYREGTIPVALDPIQSTGASQ